MSKRRAYSKVSRASTLSFLPSIWLVVLLTFLSLAAAFYLGSKYQHLWINYKGASEQDSEISYKSKNAEQGDPEVKIKTYTNQDLGFGFMYPATLNNLSDSEIQLRESDTAVSLTAKPDWVITFRKIENTTIERYSAKMIRQLMILGSEYPTLSFEEIAGNTFTKIEAQFDQGISREYLVQDGDDVVAIDTGFSLGAVDQILASLELL